MTQALDKMYTKATVEKGSFNDKEQSFVAWASRPVLDRQGEIIASNAWDIENYLKGPILLWAHDYNLPPVGTSMWTKVQSKGLKFAPKFAPTAMGKELYELYRDGFLHSFSVGFDPKDYVDDEKKTVEYIGWFGEKLSKPVRTWTDVELLEISCVPVAACPDALVERVSSGQIKTKGLQKAITDTTSKTVIPFKKYGLDPEDAEWDGPSERKEAETDDLLIMSTWYDGGEEDVKASYKLPHHRADGHNTVWRGVAAAMVALLGGRGGVDIPDGDRRGVYAHLSKHYGEFDKGVPEFKHYTELDLKVMDPGDPITELSTSEGVFIGTPEEIREMWEKSGIDLERSRPSSSSSSTGAASSSSSIASVTETIETSAGPVEGGWEATEAEERDAVEAMRQEGLAKEKDGHIPVTTELWNSLMDNTKTLTAQISDHSPEYLQKVYGGIIPPDGKWNKGLSDEFDLPVLSDVTSSFKYTLYSSYLGCEIKDICRFGYDIPSVLLGTYLETISQATDDYTVHDIRNFSTTGQETPPRTSQVQLRAHEYGEYLTDGTKFCSHEGVSIILDFDACWGGVDFDIFVSKENLAIAQAKMQEIHVLAKENNMLKGEKFSLSGEFLDPSGEDWSDVIIPKKDKLAITNSLDIIESGKSRGLLFAGPPGTGKTLSGRVIMNSTAATFIWVSTRDFGYRPSSSIISLAFDMARDLAPTVLFMEDIDSWLGGGATDAMKIEMDGIRKSNGIATILTTNFPEQLPEALIDRPGRFHHILLFDLPNLKQRHEMLSKWAIGATNETISQVAKDTDGYSGAHIKHLVDYAETIAEDEDVSIGKALMLSLDRLKEQRETIHGFKGIVSDTGIIEYSEEEMDTMIEQGIRIREQNEVIKDYAHTLKLVNAKLRVHQGGTG